jgi:tetratricopeptide (TPR) repeat protein
VPEPEEDDVDPQAVHPPGSSLTPSQELDRDLGSMAGLLAAVARTSSAALAAGAVVGGQYRIERPLGEGGMGVVYLARDTRLGRDVAVKLGSAVSTTALRRLEREAKALAKLSHPNVVVVFQVGEIEGRVFIAMEHVDGGTARAWLAAAPRTTDEILTLYGAAGDGLAAAHAAGLIHRDFKPDNVLVGADGRPRVADFGLARASDAAEPSPSPERGEVTLTTQSGAIVGTPAYMPPEQHAGGDLDARADQFAFAAAVWEALFGARPFDGRTPAEVRAAIESKPPAGPDQPRTRRVPRHVLTALRRALAAERDARWPDMGALLAELRRDPSTPRRRVTVALAVGTLAAGAAVTAVVLLLVSRGADAPACRADTAGDAARTGWTAAQRETLRQAFIATGRDDAGAVFDRVAARLDRQVAAIGTARLEACRATRVRRTQSARLLDLRNHCLDLREHEVFTLLSALDPLDAAAVDRAAPAAYALVDPATCDDAAALLGRAGRSTLDAEGQERRDEILEELAEATTLTSAGALERAEAGARDAVVRADALGDPGLRAEARIVLGLTIISHDAPAALAVLEEASRLAAEARDDALAARVAIEMFALLTWPLRQVDEAERLRPLAESALVRAGSPPRERSGYLFALSRLRTLEGNHPAAREAIEDRLSLEEAGYGTDHPRLATTLDRLAIVMMGQGQHAEAMEVQRRAVELLTAAYGPEHPQIAVVLTNLGVSYHHLGRYAEARATLVRALGIKERTLGPDHPSLGPTLVNIASTLLKEQQPAAALPYIQRAGRIVEEKLGKDHPANAQVKTVAADVERGLGHDPEAERLLVEVLAIQIEAGPDRPDIADTLVSLGDVRRARGDLRAAKDDLERARRIVEASAGPRSPAMATVLGTLAELERAEGKPGLARRTMEQAIAILEGAMGAGHPDAVAMRKQLAAWPADH